MKEIKFRAWDTITKKMFESRTINELLDEAWDVGSADGSQRDGSEYNHLIWLQFTNKLDKNKNEIYEDDIVKMECRVINGGEGFNLDGYYIGRIVINATFGVCIHNPIFLDNDTGDKRLIKSYKTIASYRSEIIGNIYENPELLKKE